MKHLLFLLLVSAAWQPFCNAQGSTIFTVAGISKSGFSGDGGPAVVAELDWPANLVFDKHDNMFIVDQWNNRIREVGVFSGLINTVAGNGVSGYSGDSLPALSAELSLPASVAVDTAGNIFIADFNNSRIREVVHSSGIIYTIAGLSHFGFSGDGGPASAAEIYNPHHVAVDNKGNLFFADEGNNRIRKIDLSTGIISTVVGTGRASFSGDFGPATAACLNSPKCVAIDDSGNMFIADWQNARIRKVDATTGIIHTVAGNGTPGYCCDSGLATAADLNYPYRVALDSAGNFYIADGSDNRIRWVNAKTGIIYTIAGNGESGFSGDGGPAQNAELYYPPGLAFDHKGNLFVADLRNNRVREIKPNITGINEVGNSQDISVYPNPTSAQTTVYFNGSAGKATLTAYSITGQMIWSVSKSASIKQVDIPVSTWMTGIYLLEIQLNEAPPIWKRLDVVR